MGTANTLGKRGVLMVLLFCSEQAVAQSGQSEQGEARPALRALRTTQPIELDGRLNEAVWQQAQPVTGFTQRDPREGTPASQRTEVRIVYDGVAVYVGARLFDTGPVSTRLGRRDSSLPGSDWFTVDL